MNFFAGLLTLTAVNAATFGVQRPDIQVQGVVPPQQQQTTGFPPAGAQPRRRINQAAIFSPQDIQPAGRPQDIQQLGRRTRVQDIDELTGRPRIQDIDELNRRPRVQDFAPPNIAGVPTTASIPNVAGAVPPLPSQFSSDQWGGWGGWGRPGFAPRFWGPRFFGPRWFGNSFFPLSTFQEAQGDQQGQNQQGDQSQQGQDQQQGKPQASSLAEQQWRRGGWGGGSGGWGGWGGWGQRGFGSPFFGSGWFNPWLTSGFSPFGFQESQPHNVQLQGAQPHGQFFPLGTPQDINVQGVTPQGGVGPRIAAPQPQQQQGIQSGQPQQQQGGQFGQQSQQPRGAQPRVNLGQPSIGIQGNPLGNTRMETQLQPHLPFAPLILDEGKGNSSQSA